MTEKEYELELMRALLEAQRRAVTEATFPNHPAMNPRPMKMANARVIEPKQLPSE